MHFTLKNSAAVLFTSLLIACGAPAEEQSTETVTETVTTPTIYNIDASASRVMWKGSMLGMYSHEGTLKFKEGTVEVLDGKVTGGKFVIDMTSINPTDDGYNEEKPKEKLIGHLSSPDFFDTENHPTASLELMAGGKAKLTIRGNTNEEMVENMDVRIDDKAFKATSNLTFDRTKYDVSFVHPMQEMVLSDDIELSIEVAATAN